MLSRFLIDSDVIIWFLRGRKETISLLEKLGRAGIPACSPISIIEVRLGMKKDEEKETSQFLDSLEIYPLDRKIANLAGEFMRRYKKKGVTPETPDAIIGATCILHNLTLVTYNIKHYPFKELKIYPLKERC